MSAYVAPDGRYSHRHQRFAINEVASAGITTGNAKLP